MSCRQALETGAMQQLGQLMSRNFELRRSMFGDAALGEVNLQMVELARQHGGELLDSEMQFHSMKFWTPRLPGLFVISCRAS